ncbi:hypothetical protein [Flectobacillus roseus]|uniref:hypothetical protein n=1 Tax=Flectobacillus roseus TaxID=502259 RepID=UPI0024B6F718|nr:hypothetical protein [Flectobacillus roseus]MDI9872239.1 hypothetical protein [Flectobacillus roseus]
MEKIPVGDVIKWFKMNGRPDWDILKGKEAIFGYDDKDDLTESLTKLEEVLQELPSGEYKIRARKFKGPNSSYKQIDFTVSSQNQSIQPSKKMATEAEIKERIALEVDNAKKAMLIEFLQKDIDSLKEKVRDLEKRFNELLDIVEDLHDGDSSNDSKAKNSLGNLIKEGADMAKNSQGIVNLFKKSS